MIVKDTGYNRDTAGRCYYVSERTVEFAEGTPDEVIAAFIDSERRGWYGQEFYAIRSGNHVSIRRGVDSSD